MEHAWVEGDETEVLRRAQQGDERAFARLVALHQHEVYTLALRLLADPDLAAEASQETFIRAWRALPNFRGDAALSTWLYRIAVNTSWTVRRKARRHQSVPLEDAMHQPAGGLGPEAMGEVAELRGRLASAVGGLPVAQRQVVVLKDIYGWSHAEVADSLGITVTAAKVRLHRARKRLQTVLQEVS